MRTSKFTIILISMFLLILAVGCSSVKTPDENASAREMGFPSLTSVPKGFSYSKDKSIDMGDWCEIIYENDGGDIISLDCYELDTFELSFLSDYAALEDKTSINNTDASIYKFNSDNINILVWKDESSNALCLLGGSISLDKLVKTAESVKFDMKKAVILPDDDEITSYTRERDTIEDAPLQNLSDVLDYSTEPLFDYIMKNDKTQMEFELESFYKSFDFSAKDDLLVEVFNYEYSMKAEDSVAMVGGMVRDDDGHIRGFKGSFGQIAALSRNGKLIKAVPLTNLDVELTPEGADHETSEWLVENVMLSIKSPQFIKRNMLYN